MLMLREHAGGTRTLAAADDFDVAADERVGQSRHADDATVLEHHGVLDLGVDNFAIVGHGGERPDVGIHEARPRSDDSGSPHGGGHELRSLFDHDAPVDL